MESDIQQSGRNCGLFGGGTGISIRDGALSGPSAGDQVGGPKGLFGGTFRGFFGGDFGEEPRGFIDDYDDYYGGNGGGWKRR